MWGNFTVKKWEVKLQNVIRFYQKTPQLFELYKTTKVKRVAQDFLEPVKNIWDWKTNVVPKDRNVKK